MMQLTGNNNPLYNGWLFWFIFLLNFFCDCLFFFFFLKKTTHFFLSDKIATNKQRRSKLFGCVAELVLGATDGASCDANLILAKYISSLICKRSFLHLTDTITRKKKPVVYFSVISSVLSELKIFSHLFFIQNYFYIEFFLNHILTCLYIDYIFRLVTRNSSLSSLTLSSEVPKFNRHLFLKGGYLTLIAGPQSTACHRLLSCCSRHHISCGPSDWKRPFDALLVPMQLEQSRQSSSWDSGGGGLTRSDSDCDNRGENKWHSLAKLSSKLHLFACVDVLAQSLCSNFFLKWWFPFGGFHCRFGHKSPLFCLDVSLSNIGMGAPTPSLPPPPPQKKKKEVLYLFFIISRIRIIICYEMCPQIHFFLSCGLPVVLCGLKAHRLSFSMDQDLKLPNYFQSCICYSNLEHSSTPEYQRWILGIPWHGQVVVERLGKNHLEELTEFVLELVELLAVGDFEAGTVDIWLYDFVCGGISTGELIRLCKSSLDLEFLFFGSEGVSRTNGKFIVSPLMLRNHVILFQKWISHVILHSISFNVEKSCNFIPEMDFSCNFT
ncbi:hypothetical protein VP01_28g3 [Puccinia sorghi]|uniref:Uncharacterized protein n=1 Tax=Puccinia sorghi TaxID=27349 RepID=A0A0L6V271_9BASI|nr:hypothetical protein VP01_28g3 [Puccinia sorghi]